MSIQSIESLGEKKFEIPKSKMRLAFWSGLLVFCALAIVYFAQGRSLTGNEFLLIGWLGVAQFLFIVEFFRSRVIVYTNGIVRRRLFGQAYHIVFTPYLQLFIHRRCFGLGKWRFWKRVSLRLHDELHDYRIPSGFSRNEEIVAEIENYLFQSSMHRMNQIYDSGETLDFAAVQLNRNHISIKNKHLNKDEWGDFDVRFGKFRLYAKNQKGKIKRLAFAKTPISEIANFRLFCRFIDLNDADIKKYGYRVYGIPFLIKA